jgi:hypothetical protein
VNLNPMFSNKVSSKKKSKIFVVNEHKRKKRSDAKKDIKVPVTLEQKRGLKLIGYNKQLSITEYASQLVGEALNRSYIKFCPAFSYPKNSQFVHVKLSQEQHQKVVQLSAYWNCSIRQAAHRILINQFHEERGEGIDADVQIL